MQEKPHSEIEISPNLGPKVDAALGAAGGMSEGARNSATATLAGAADGVKAGGDPFAPASVKLKPVEPAQVKVELIGTLINAVLTLVLAAGATGGNLWWFRLPWVHWVVAAVASVALVACLVEAFLVRRRVRARGWGLSEHDLYIRSGLMFKKLNIVPLARIQYVDVRQGPVQRYFGVSQVSVYTAASGSAAAIAGLSEADAAWLREHVSDQEEIDLAGV